MHRNWLVKRTNPEYVRYISKTASVSPILAQILINRGIKTAEDISYFLKPSISDLSDPFKLPGLKTAAERIKLAIERKEKILIHGDYDADGLTATAIIMETLQKLGADADYFIPHRIAHGYGFNAASIEAAKKSGVSLIITVDCGITSFETAAEAKKEKIDLIISDHHEPMKNEMPSPQRLARGEDAGRRIENRKNRASGIVHQASFKVPDALAVINPKLNSVQSSEDKSKLLNLSGAGIALKIVQGIDMLCGADYASQCFDLAALGTIADVVPLIGENRIIVKEGLKLIHEGQRHAVNALKNIASLGDRELYAELLSFTIVPRINAAGRISDANDVVRLLISENENESSELSRWLDDLNSERQKLNETMYQEAFSDLNERGLAEAKEKPVIVLFKEGWHQGVLGIVASRLAEEFNRPAFVLSIKDGIAKGSVRSIPSFDISQALSECSKHLISFGGHKQAAGIKLKAEDIPAFEIAIQEMAKKALSENDFIPALEIDADVDLNEVNHVFVSELSMLEPLGYGNEEPFLGAKNLEVVNPRIVGNNHLKMRLKQGNVSIDTIGFNMAQMSSDLLDNNCGMVDAVFTPAFNDWNGERYLQLNLKAFRPSK